MQPDVALIGVDTNDSRSDALSFLASTGVAFRSGFDDQAETARAFRVIGLPAAVVVTPAGRIAARFLGPVGVKQLADAVSVARKP